LNKNKTADEQPPPSATEEFELLLRRGEEPGKYVLRLYVSGTTPNSQRAIDNIRKICEEHLQNRYELEIIDIYQQPALARDGQIVAAPTLIKKLPLPLRRFIGDMSKTEKILIGLDLEEKSQAEERDEHE
jgi:circadian clock protein KaiB